MTLYGCHNKTRPSQHSTYWARSGYGATDGSVLYGRQELWAKLKPAFDLSECQYTKTHATDKLCTGCIHQHKEQS